MDKKFNGSEAGHREWSKGVMGYMQLVATYMPWWDVSPELHLQGYKPLESPLEKVSLSEGHGVQAASYG